MAEVTAAFAAQLGCRWITCTAIGTVDIRSSFNHAYQGFILDEVKFVFFYQQELNIRGLWCTATGATFNWTGIHCFTRWTFPN
jgi:hypothetical protein